MAKVNKNDFIFIRNDYSYNSEIVAKLAVIVIDEDYDYWHIKTRPIKATKQNIELLKTYAKEHATDYTYCEYDCTGSVKRSYRVKIKNGKCWLIECGNVDC